MNKARRNNNITRVFARSFPHHLRHMAERPMGLEWPVITADQAVERGIDPAAIHRAADWCMERSRGGRVTRFVDNAERLSAAAFEVRRRMNADQDVPLAVAPLELAA